MHKEENEQENLDKVNDYSDFVIEEEPFIPVYEFSKLENLSQLNHSDKSDKLHQSETLSKVKLRKIDVLISCN